VSYHRSNQPNLYIDDETGIYVVRTKVQGRTIWKSLRTADYRVAKFRLAKALAELQKGRLDRRARSKGPTSFGELAALYRERVQTSTRLKPSSKHYRIQTIDAILRFRPKWKDKAARDIGETDCLEWAHKYSDKVHGTRFNNTVGTLRAIFEMGLQAGLLPDNPARSIGEVRVTGKKLDLPNAEQFAAILGHIESSGAWCAQDAADLVRFLAYSGCRITEATHVKVQDVDLVAGTIRVLGDPVHGTKGGESRSIPINQPMRELCVRLLDSQHASNVVKPNRKGYLLKLTECRKALTNACAKAGVPRIGHHDLRHLFITRAIEAEIPVPTVARWCGHKDGGALIMRTYAHLLDAHSKAMANRMKF
jgi:integrase